MKNGLLLVYTHDGAQAPCSALGQAIRALGRGFKVCVIDFGSELNACGQTTLAACFGEQLQICSPVAEISSELADPGRDRVSLPEVWRSAIRIIQSRKCDMAILLGLTQLMATNKLNPDEVLRVLASRPKEKHVVITGRDAPQTLIDAADIVTEIKHL